MVMLHTEHTSTSASRVVLNALKHVSDLSDSLEDKLNYTYQNS